MADTIEKCREDLASAARVQTRLATSTTDQSLPQILSALLPRLMRKMDKNFDDMMKLAAETVTLDDGMSVDGVEGQDESVDSSSGACSSAVSASTCCNQLLEVRTALHTEYKSILDHSIERLLGRGYGSSTSEGAAAASATGSHARWNDSEWIDAISVFLLTLCQPGEAVEDAPTSTRMPDASANILNPQRPLGRPGLKYALALLRTALACTYQYIGREEKAEGEGTTTVDKSCANTALMILKASVAAVEYIHRERCTLTVGVTPADEQMLSREDDISAEASWLFLDTIAILFGARPISFLSEYYWLCDNISRTAAICPPQNTPDIVSCIAPIVGGGVFNLLLDLVLFRPSSSCSRCGGMSILGTKGMRYPTRRNDDGISSGIGATEWQELKIAALEAAVGQHKGEGFLGSNLRVESDDHENEGQALTLVVLASANVEGSRFGQLAKSLLRPRMDGARCRATSLHSKRLKHQGQDEQKSKASFVRAGRLLLRLTLGEGEANTLAVQGSSAVNGRLARMPLTPRDTATVLGLVIEALHVLPNQRDAFCVPAHYVTSTHAISIGEVDKETISFVHLALAAATRALHLAEPDTALRQRIVAREGWTTGGAGCDLAATGARTLRALAQWFAHIASINTGKSQALDSTIQLCFDTAANFLRTDVLPSLNAAGQGDGGNDVRMQYERDDAADQPQNEIPYRMRGILAAQERARMIRLTRILPPSQIRCCCLEVVRDLVSYVVLNCNATQASDEALGKVSFDLPVLLLNCLVVDKELSSHVVSDALDEALKVYRSIAKEETEKKQSSDTDLKDTRSQCVAPLLPALLTASTSEDYIARRVALRWTTGVLQYLDSAAAYILCTYFYDDPDKEIVRAAQACVSSIKTEMNRSGNDVDAVSSGTKAPIFFLDSSVDLTNQLLLSRIASLNESLADLLGVSVESASIILRRNHFSLNEAAQAMQCRGVAPSCNATQSKSYSSNGKESNIKCGICLEESSDNYSLTCGHLFCKPCYSTYVTLKIDDESILDSTCPQEGCNERFACDDVKALLPDKVKICESMLLKSYIERSSECRYCPGADCSMIAISDTAEGQGSCTMCGTSFCFECGMNPHIPAACDECKGFIRLLESSEYWIQKNAKPCPGCKAPIEKNTGCNHMTCTKCTAHFCWVCLTPIDADGDLNRHVCNRYDPTNDFTEKRRNEFFLSRYEAHAQAESFAKRQLDKLEDSTSVEMDTDNATALSVDFAPDHSDILLHAVRALIRCRSFLKYSFVTAWGWPLNRPKNELFESHQATLELFTEKLSGLVEVDFDVLLSSRGEYCFRMHFRAISFHTIALESYIDRMISFLDRLV